MVPHMSRKLIVMLVTVGFMMPVGVLAQSPRIAKSDNAKPAVSTPRTEDGHPDLSGYWGHLSEDDQKLAAAGEQIVDGPEGGDGTPEAFSWWITHFEMDA